MFSKKKNPPNFLYFQKKKKKIPQTLSAVLSQVHMSVSFYCSVARTRVKEQNITMSFLTIQIHYFDITIASGIIDLVRFEVLHACVYLRI